MSVELLHRKNCTVPVGSVGFVAPVTVTVAVSWTGVPGVTVPVDDDTVVTAAWQTAN